MTAVAVEPLVGSVEPRLSSYPEAGSSAGQDAISIAEKAGLFLDEWQKRVLIRSLGERDDDGRWLTPDVAVVCSRQNGKNSILEARLLAGLFLFDEELIIHTAHEMKAAAVTFRRIVSLIKRTPDLLKRVANFAYSKGEEGIELHNGHRLRFMARTGGSGRSFSADLLILDEAYNLPDHVMNALTPTLASRPNPQVWYTSSAVNQIDHPHGLTLARVRRRGLAGDDPGLAFFEWSGDEEAYKADPKGYAADPRSWALANPATNIVRRDGTRGPDERFFSTQLRRLGPVGFATEHLSIGDWPEEPTDLEVHVIDPEVWDQLVDRMSTMVDPIALAVHASPGGRAAAICAAGYRPDDGLVHVEVIEHHPNITWVVDRVADLVRSQNPCAVMVDPGGPAGHLIAPLKNAGVDVKPFTYRDYQQACTGFLTAATERSEDLPAGGLRHQDDERLNDALRDAKTRALGQGWVWDQLATSTDLSPLIAVTLAMHGLSLFGDQGTVNLW